MTVLILLGTLLGGIAIGMPIAFALLVAGGTLMWQMGMFNGQIIANNVIHGADSYPLLAVPFFLLAGELMNAGGLSKRLVNFAMAMVGHVKGGLGYVTIVAGVMMAALSGSAVADAAMITALLLPMMASAGHDRARSAGLIASSSIIAPVIPPSIGFIVFGVAANVSISHLFMAGIAPGVMMGLTLSIVWWLLSRREPVSPQPRRSRTETLRSFRDAGFALVLPIIVLVGLRMGVFTPTEAGVIAAVYALAVSVLVYREITFNQVVEAFIAAARTSAVVMLLVAAAGVTAWLITVANIPRQIVDLFEPLIANPILLLVAMMVLVLLVGMVLDLTPTILVLVPVLMPLVNAAGIDPVYFGVIFMMNCAIGLLTPPVGVVLNTVAGVGKLSVERVAIGVMPFLVAQVVLMFLFVIFPDLVLIPAALFH